MTQFVATFLMPIPLVLLVLLAGLVAGVRGRRRLSGAAFGLACALLFLFSWQPFATLLIAPLEQQYPPLLDVDDARGAEYVLVLGAGHAPDADRPLSSRLTSMAMIRLAEGVRVHRALEGSTLVTSGGGPAGNMAGTMAEVARSWGVENVLTHDSPHNTFAEAVTAAEQFGDARFVLVTSASHMPRAMLFFRARGLDPIPAPTQYMASENPAVNGWAVRHLRPSANALRTTERAVYEYLGIAWARLRGGL